MDLVQATATVLFLWLAAEPKLEKLDRIKVKYGLISGYSFLSNHEEGYRKVPLFVMHLDANKPLLSAKGRSGFLLLCDE